MERETFLGRPPPCVWEFAFSVAELIPSGKGFRSRFNNSYSYAAMEAASFDSLFPHFDLVTAMPRSQAGVYLLTGFDILMHANHGTPREFFNDGFVQRRWGIGDLS